MNFQKNICLLLFLFAISFINAQNPWTGTPTTDTPPIYRIGNTGIATTNPLSPLSVNGIGDSRWSGYFHSTGNTNGSTALFAEVDQPIGFADIVRAVSGTIESGSGYAQGLYGSAYTATPSNSGRAYGVYAQAGNASNGANYGLYARLAGSNGGAAVFGSDDINYGDPTSSDNLLGNRTWAGYFIGDLHVSAHTGLGSTTNPLSTLSVNGDGDSRWSGYFHSTGNTNGSTALFAEVDQPTGFADIVRAVSGTIESGSGYAQGIYGSAYTATPSNSGRAYGVYAQAGNASNGANYGLYARLAGSNGGAAVFGSDDVNYGDPTSSDNLLGNRTWAGYFIGDVEVTNAVGIGCTNMVQPIGGVETYRLFVNGGIVSKELMVRNGGSWCDYVFEDAYELTSLEEVEAHIAEKGHLHNTPSAAEIASNEGFEVGKITLNQQEKIEEIFLHLIEMNKEIEDLKSENAALKAALSDQK